MQNVRTSKLGDALTWVELTYNNIKLEVYVFFGVLAIIIVVMCLGAYLEALQQASLFLALTPQQDAAMMQVMNLINQYGLGVLVAICYFSNVWGGGKRRDLLLDALCIAAAVLLPQLVFHSAWLYAAHTIINTYGLTVSAAVVNTVSLEWLTVGGLCVVSGMVALQARRLKMPKPRNARKQ